MITILIENDDVAIPNINANLIRKICKKILSDNNQNEAVLTIIFSNDSQLFKLKKEYFGEDFFTDTISFNLEEDGDPIEGEVYISIERVHNNAQIYKQEFITECKRVIIHGCLHLLGYNDQTAEEKITMTMLEEKYLSQIIAEN